MATNTKTNYQLHLKGFVGGFDFDADYVDYILSKHEGKEVHVRQRERAFRGHERQCCNNCFSWSQTHHHGRIGHVPCS